jgi:hypothetical protein
MEPTTTALFSMSDYTVQENAMVTGTDKQFSVDDLSHEALSKLAAAIEENNPHVTGSYRHLDGGTVRLGAHKLLDHVIDGIVLLVHEAERALLDSHIPF